ncbi:MAG: hypothetical protein GC158_13310 [Cyanobacteria bacterium RI_101]|nr:hypothetical protein [Cyanobacteria bacterium RI_101]
MYRSIRISGPAQSGKTEALGAELRDWLRKAPRDGTLLPVCLVLAANRTSGRQWQERLETAPDNLFFERVKTPSSWARDEVFLHWPLILEDRERSAPFPLLLKPETEQALALDWAQTDLAEWPRSLSQAQQYRLLRQVLDLLQLAGGAGLTLEEMISRLELAYGSKPSWGDFTWEASRRFLRGWRAWCGERGFLSYGLVWDLLAHSLFPNRDYQDSLLSRYQGLAADDLQDYPALMGDLFKLLAPQLDFLALSYNPEGETRSGQGADSDYLIQVAQTLTAERKTLAAPPSVGQFWRPLTLEILQDPEAPLPPSIQSLQTLSRAALLREVAEFIIAQIQAGAVRPEEIAIIAPGLDEIARYTLLEILTPAGVPIEPLNEQRPLNSSALTRAFLTLLALLYPNLGEWARQDDAAEMLTLLSLVPEGNRLAPTIDPLRAGLLADACFVPDPQAPRLLPYQTYNQWHRFGRRASAAYDELWRWLEEMKSNLPPSPWTALERALSRFLPPLSALTPAQRSGIQELAAALEHYETAQNHCGATDASLILGGFLRILYSGSVAANAYPLIPLAPPSRAVVLATIYQYRSLRQRHPWQFWLDAGDALWEKGGAAQLFGAPLCRRLRPLEPWTTEEEESQNQRRFEGILNDLLGRATRKVILCHSDLSIRGAEQTGPLLTWIQQAPPATGD